MPSARLPACPTRRFGTLEQSPAAKQSARRRARLRVDLSELLHAIKRYDLAGMEAIVNRHAVMLPPDTLVFAVVLPVLREMGERWQAGTVRPAQEHLVSAVMRTVLGGLLRTLLAARGTDTLVFATLAGERHELGLLCAAVLAASAGHRRSLSRPRSADGRHCACRPHVQRHRPGARPERRRWPSNAGELAPLKRLPARRQYPGSAAPHATPIREALGNRARHVASIRELADLLERHVA